MKLKQLESDSSLIDLAPLIDVVFLLLIFLMVASKFDQKSLMDLTLPEAGMNQSQETQEHAVSIFKDGSVAFNSERIDKSALKQKLITEKVKTLIIQADENAKFKDFVFVMDIAKSANLKEIKIEHKVK